MRRQSGLASGPENQVGGTVDLRRVAGLLALLGGLLWIGQVTVLVVTDGEFPWPRVEAVVYNLGMLLIAVAAGVVGYRRAEQLSAWGRAIGAGAAAVAVPGTILLTQISLFPLPGQHWLESDAPMIALAILSVDFGLRGWRAPPSVRSHDPNAVL